MTDTGDTRRDFLRRVGAAGAAALTGSGDLAFAQAPAPVDLPILPAQMVASPFPTLNRRTLGWLRFLWEKATTPDDWSAAGIPHMWWDRYTAPVVLSYGRFDLAYSSYALLLMADQTPAWREVYTRISDQLVSRYPTWWGAIDWLTQIGDDPKRANYPPPIMNGIPEAWRGKYNRFGWTANGIEPYGLQPDPIGADGYLFFRGWFTLTLAIYQYIAGDGKWAQPFPVTGYHDERFEWDQHRIAERLASQYRDHPEGPHCENTKIWFFCNTAAGLGLYLYDKVFGRQTHGAFHSFLEYARENYIGVSNDGRLEWVTSYYDPVADFKINGGAAGGLSTAFLLLPQHPEMAEFIYEAAVMTGGWRDPRQPARANATALLMARELGDDVAVARLTEAAERDYDPRFFGEHQEKFGWWFNLNEPYPRGQQSAMMMIAEVGRGGEWRRAFDTPHLDKFTAPTVEGIDFPAMGVFQAWNDPDTGTLFVGTYAASPDRQGLATGWRVTNLPNPADVIVLCDGEPFDRSEVTGPGTIRIDATIDYHRYQIFTGYRGTEQPANAARSDTPGQIATGMAITKRPAGDDAQALRRAGGDLLSPAGATCPCCQA